MAGLTIRKVAVLGSGVMGAGIAAHVAGAGFPVLLLDIVPPMAPPAGVDTASPAWRNKFSLDAKERLLKSKPNAYHTKSDADLIEVGNLTDDLARLNECDWVIEAVKEDLGVKRELFSRIDAVRKPGLVLTTNTSGLPIASLVEGRSDDFRKNFFVTHFFNPPRYMRLLEIVSGPDSDARTVESVVRWGEEVLGKGIVFGKDTPNFVANRIGTYGVLDTLRLMVEEGFTSEEVDTLLGTPVGHPKSALLRTVDLVGLDTLGHVAKNCHALLTDDEDRDVFQLPAVALQMIEKGLLGDKTKAGFYRKGKEGLETLDLTTGTYRPQAKAKLAAVKQVKDIENVGERIAALVRIDDRHAKFAWKTIARVTSYAARRLGEISDDVLQIDRAMRWGFNWELGPFEGWDAIGFEYAARRMKDEGYGLPGWVDEMLAAGVTGFYRDGGREFYDPFSKQFRPIPGMERTVRLPRHDAKKLVEENASASLWDIGDGVYCVEFHSKMNSVDSENTRMLVEGLARAERDGAGLVVANEASDAFCAGANLFMVLMAANAAEEDPSQWGQLETVVKDFQQANQLLKFANVPVVAAPFGLTLGGGAEIALGAQAIRAHCELYMGLVEVGVGLIPGGGGTKEVLWRLTQHIRDDEDLFPHLRRAFETIAMAKVSMSASEARDLGFLQAGDKITFNRDLLIRDAKNTVLSMNLAGFRPQKPRLFRVGGRPAFANLQAALWSMEQAHQISAHDRKIANKLAWVMCGGDVPANARVTEQYLLDLEREAFMSLVGEEKTKARMLHMLQNGKPLRN